MGVLRDERIQVNCFKSQINFSWQVSSSQRQAVYLADEKNVKGRLQHEQGYVNDVSDCRCCKYSEYKVRQGRFLA